MEQRTLEFYPKAAAVTAVNCMACATSHSHILTSVNTTDVHNMHIFEFTS